MPAHACTCACTPPDATPSVAPYTCATHLPLCNPHPACARRRAARLLRPQRPELGLPHLQLGGDGQGQLPVVAPPPHAHGAVSGGEGGGLQALRPLELKPARECLLPCAATPVPHCDPPPPPPPPTHTHTHYTFLHPTHRYFHAYRIDHILGFFRIWEIPGDCASGILGRFRPSIPLSRGVRARLQRLHKGDRGSSWPPLADTPALLPPPRHASHRSWRARASGTLTGCASPTSRMRCAVLCRAVPRCALQKCSCAASSPACVWG